MDVLDIITIIGQAITFLGIIFIVYNYFRNPQIKSEKTDALLTQRFNMLESAFNNLRDNHIHTIDTKLDENSKLLNCLQNEVTKLATIIDERIPKK